MEYFNMTRQMRTILKVIKICLHIGYTVLSRLVKTTQPTFPFQFRIEGVDINFDMGYSISLFSK